MEGGKGPAVPKLPLHSLDQSHLGSPKTRGSSSQELFQGSRSAHAGEAKSTTPSRVLRSGKRIPAGGSARQLTAGLTETAELDQGGASGSRAGGSARALRSGKQMASRSPSAGGMSAAGLASIGRTPATKSGRGRSPAAKGQSTAGDAAATPAGAHPSPAGQAGARADRAGASLRPAETQPSSMSSASPSSTPLDELLQAIRDTRQSSEPAHILETQGPSLAWADDSSAVSTKPEDSATSDVSARGLGRPAAVPSSPAAGAAHSSPAGSRADVGNDAAGRLSGHGGRVVSPAARVSRVAGAASRSPGAGSLATRAASGSTAAPGGAGRATPTAGAGSESGGRAAGWASPGSSMAPRSAGRTSSRPDSVGQTAPAGGTPDRGAAPRGAGRASARLESAGQLAPAGALPANLPGAAGLPLVAAARASPAKLPAAPAALPAPADPELPWQKPSNPAPADAELPWQRPSSLTPGLSAAATPTPQLTQPSESLGTSDAPVTSDGDGLSAESSLEDLPSGYVPRGGPGESYMQKKLRDMQGGRDSLRSMKVHKSKLEQAKEDAAVLRAGELSETDQAAVRRLVQRAVAHAVATQGQGLSETLVKHVSRLEREKETAAAQRRDDQEAAEARSRARNVVHTPQTGGLASLPKHKSRLEQEKDAAVAAQATAGPSKPLPSYMRPTSASQAMKKGAEFDLGSLPKHKSRLEREKEAATASASSRPRPAAARSRPGTAGQATGGLGDGLVKHKSRLERDKENAAAAAASSTVGERSVRQARAVTAGQSNAGGSLADLKLHKSKLQQEKEAWAKAASKTSKVRTTSSFREPLKKEPSNVGKGEGSSRPSSSRCPPASTDKSGQAASGGLSARSIGSSSGGKVPGYMKSTQLTNARNSLQPKEFDARFA